MHRSKVQTQHRRMAVAGIVVGAGVSLAFVRSVQTAIPRHVEIASLELTHETYAPIQKANSVGVGHYGARELFACNYTTNPAYVTSPDGGNYSTNPAYYTSPNGGNLTSNPAYYTFARPLRDAVVKGCSDRDPTACESPLIGGVLRVVYRNHLSSLPASKPLPLPKMTRVTAAL